jgi:Tfp pilus assembly protein PilO
MKNSSITQSATKKPRQNKPDSFFDSFAEKFIDFYQLFIFIVVIICILATSLGLFLIYNKQIKPVENEITIQDSLLAKRQAQLADYQNTSKQFSNLTEFEQKIIQILPISERKDILFVEFEAIAWKNNLVLQSININQSLSKDEEQTDEVQKLSIELGLSGGNYFEMKNFIRDIENSLRIIEIKAVNYSPDSDLFSVSAETFYYAK